MSKTNNDTLTRLDQEWFFILDISKDNLKAFDDDPVKSKIVKAWLHKLSRNLYLTYDDKVKRNSLLCGLASCLQSKNLTGFYKQHPKDPLPTFDVQTVNSNDPEWLESLHENSQKEPFMFDTPRSKDCRTFVSSKLLEEGRGSMAYIALSVTDEGENPWNTLSESFNTDFSKMKNNLEKRSPKMTTLLYRNLVQLIDNELAERIKPKSNYILETILQSFINTHKDEPRIRKLFKIRSDNQRSMLLQLLKAELMDYIVRREVGNDILKPDTLANKQLNDETNTQSDLSMMFNGADKTIDSELLLHERVMLQRAAAFKNSLKKIDDILHDENGNSGLNIKLRQQQDKLQRTLRAAEYSGARK